MVSSKGSKTSEVKTEKRKKRVKKTKTPVYTDIKDTFVLVAVDPSFRRPGFAIITVLEKEIQNIKTYYLDNTKEKYKSKGEIINDIANFFMNTIMKERLEMSVPLINKTESIPDTYFVREAAINSRGSQTEIPIFEVVGVLDYLGYGYGLQWDELFPITVKCQIGGSRSASKKDVENGLERYVGKRTYVVDDESDAVAVGIAWMLKNKIISEVK